MSCLNASSISARAETLELSLRCLTGLVTISLTGMACGYLGLPFEAAFILFVAVDPICDMLRTLVLVVGNSAAVSLICSRPLKI